MGGASIWHWIVVGLVVMLLFGRGKISEMMGDVAKGIKAFKKGMSEDEAAPATPTTTTTVTSEPLKTIDHQPVHAAGAAPAAVGPTSGTATFGERKIG